MRKDSSELQINRKLRRRPLLDQIRPHGLGQVLILASSSGFSAITRAWAGDCVSFTLVAQLLYPTLVKVDVFLVLRKQTFV
jgi:hypothetical protein